MKKLFFMILTILLTACSPSNDINAVNCERAGLINKSIRMVLKADQDNDQQMRDLAICFGAEMYDVDNNSLKEILNSEVKEQDFILNTLKTCQTKLQNITKNDFDIMARKALRASEVARKYDTCFK